MGKAFYCSNIDRQDAWVCLFDGIIVGTGHMNLMHWGISSGLISFNIENEMLLYSIGSYSIHMDNNSFT